jgi:Tfp pilus assembly protein PilV
VSPASFGRRRRTRRHPSRAGTTLIEVIVSFVILGTGLVAMASFASTFVRAVSDSDLRGRAAEIAADRLETVKGGTDYETLDVTFAEPTAVAVPDAPGFTRQTLFRRVGGKDADPYDYRVVTVVVTGRALRQPVRRTTVIGDF